MAMNCISNSTGHMLDTLLLTPFSLIRIFLVIVQNDQQVEGQSTH